MLFRGDGTGSNSRICCHWSTY